MTWTAGTLSGNTGRTIISAGATLTLNGAVTHQLDGRSLINDGDATWTGSGGLLTINGAVFDNNSSFDIQTNATLNGIFDNSGILQKSAGGANTIRNAFNNRGTVEILTSKLRIHGGTGTHSGLFDVRAGAELEFFGLGTHTFDTAAQLTGQGTVRMVQENSRGSEITLNGDLTFNGRFVDNGAELMGAGSLTVAEGGQMEWTLGKIRVDTTIAPSATLALSGGQKTIEGATLTNQGNATWTGGDLGAFSGGRFDNQGSFNIQTDASLSSAFDNYGTVLKTAGAANDIPGLFNNHGQVVVTNAGLRFRCGSCGTPTHSGTFNAAAGTQIEFFESGNYVFESGSQWTGQGTFRTQRDANFFGPTLILRDALTTASPVILNGGRVEGAGSLNVSSGGQLAWQDGVLQVDTTIAPGATLTMSGPRTKSFSQRTFTNQGNATWTGATLALSSGAIFDNQGTFDIQTDARMDSFDTTFANHGTLIKSVGAGTNDLGLNFLNSGNLQVVTGTLLFSRGYTQDVTGTLNIRIGGSTPVLDFDQFNVTGQAALNGTLEIALVEGYEPNIGEAFTVLTFDSRSGAFATLNGLDIGNGKRFEVVYGAAGVTLTVVTAP
jgi:hypothetical protein